MQNINKSNVIFRKEKIQSSVIICAILLFAFTSSFSQKVVRGPYLQAATSNSIVVRWRTDIATNSVVKYGASADNLSSSATEPTITTEHEVKLTNLQPTTLYYYNIGSTTQIQAGGNDYFFKTPPPIGSTSKIRLWAMGDIGTNTPNQFAVRDAYLKSINQNNLLTDAVLMLGDNAYGSGTDDEYQRNFFNIYQDHFFKNNVLWTIPGNHEYYSGSPYEREVAYFKIFSPTQQGEAGGVASGTKMYYSFDMGNVHIIALDSYGIEEQKYKLFDTLSPQVQWLKKDLIANKLPWTIVMFHHPPYTKNSHNSDAEIDLVAIRQNLTPILERFGVDLVLSGHSHLYERSRLMRGHTGMSDTFDATKHLFTTSSGFYDGQPNSCAYVKNTGKEGTIYAVVGSSGQNNGVDGTPHPAMPYKKAIIGGSAIIEVENNRLDFKFLGSDGIVYDKFTIFKQTNKTTQRQATHGDIINLTPSWKGTYSWSNNQILSTISPRILSDTTFSVRDSQGCLEDKFQIKLTAKPTIKIQNIEKTVCLGEQLSVPIEITNTNASLWQYKVELSNEKGEFSSPLQIGVASPTNAAITMPLTVKESSEYRIRIIANTATIPIAISEKFTIAHPATATISGNSTIEAGNSSQLTIQATGTPPWTIKLSDNQILTSSTTPFTVSVSPLVTTNYSLTSVSNVCGVGKAEGNVKIGVIPQIKTLIATQQPICNGSEITVNFEQIGQFEKPVEYAIQLSDNGGNFANPKTVATSVQSPIKVAIPVPTEVGNYKIRVLPTDNSIATIIPSSNFQLYKKATATIKGDTTIQFGGSAKLKVALTGTPPWSYTLSDNTTDKTDTPFIEIKVSPQATTTYTLKSVENICGAGAINGSASVQVLITSIYPNDEFWHIYPNPTSNQITLKWQNIKPTKWELVDMTGKVIQQGNVLSFNNNQIEINVKNLQSGTYIIRLFTSSQIYRQQFLKN